MDQSPPYTVSPGKGRVIKAAEAQIWQNADKALARAHEILIGAEKDASIIRQNAIRNGRAEGREAAAKEKAKKLIDMQEKMQEEILSLEKTVVDIVIASVENIFSQLPTEELLTETIKKSLYKFSGKYNAKLLISKQEENLAQKALRKVQTDLGLEKSTLEIEISPDLESGHRLIAGAFGVVDISPDQLISRLRSDLEHD